MPTARSALRSELTKQLLPALRALGFAGPSSIAGNGLLHDFKRHTNQGTHLLTVQLEKHGRPRFVIGLSIEPTVGFESVLRSGGVVRQGRLKPRRGAGTGAWFRTDVPLWRRLLGQSGISAAQAVASCVSLLPEAEAWWQNESSTEHILVFEQHFPGQSKARA